MPLPQPTAPPPALVRCQGCHGGSAPAGGVSLASRARVLQGKVLVPGSPEKSRLYTLAASGKMPPGNPLSPTELASLKRWIVAGAPWPTTAAPPSLARAGVWAFQPVGFPTVPQPKHPTEVRNAIDAFVLAKLEAKGLGFAPEADRRTLIRRVTFDLTGLPPTPEELTAFVADKRPDAYERLIDRLLASPHYGERWARHWLDVARFGESHGYEYDHLREHAWRYRDWVVEALNADLPYDRFIHQQLAGDIDGNPVATGFLVGGPMDEAGKAAAGVQVRLRAREEELEDMIGLVGQTFLGLTTNCARCHDHKFDPIPARDYYRLKAALAGVQPGNRPILTAAQQAQRNTALEQHKAQQSRLQAQLTALEAPVRARLLAERTANPTPTGPLPTYRWGFEEQGGSLKLDGKTRFQTEKLPLEFREKTLESWVRLSDLNQQGGSALTLETDNGTQFDAVVFGERQKGKWIAGSEFYHRTKDLDAPLETEQGLVQLVVVYRASGEIQLYRNGQPYGAAYTPPGEGLRTYAAGTAHALFGQRHTGAPHYLKGEIEEARLYNRALSAAEIAQAFQSAPFNLSPEALEQALSPAQKQERERLRQALAEGAKQLRAQEAPLLAYAATSQQPGPTYVLPRGDVNLKGEQVTPGGLSAITTCAADFGLAADSPEASRRLALSQWLTDPRNPLPARVMVNRVWQWHFGRGLVGTPNDFGFNGERPSHPELLDWLASAFMGPGEGSLKRLHRAILLSRTYRQSTQATPKALAVDADNRLLWHFAPRRLEAEVVRDSMLAVSGKLNPTLAGPSFRPFTVTNYGSDFYQLLDKDTPEFNRRTLYRMTVQSARSPLLETLDCPDPSTKTPKRTITTTPIQALALMNDSFVVRQSKAFAQRVEREAGSAPEAQLLRAYALAFGRTPTAPERTRARTYLKAHSLESFCWALLNASEFLYAK